MSRGYENSEVRFHWLLAMLSGRTFGQLSAGDHASLQATRKHVSADAGSPWADGADLIYSILDSLIDESANIGLVILQLDDLGSLQRDMILVHLEIFIQGPIENQFWERALEHARNEQKRSQRENRAWIFFQPDPAGARARRPVPVATSSVDKGRVIVAASVSAVAIGWLDWLLARNVMLLPLLASLISVAAGYACFVNGLEWRHCVDSLRAREEALQSPSPRAGPTAGDGFASRVDRLFDHYFTKYQPVGANPAAWSRDTAGIRSYLRDEMVEIYREQRVTAEQLAWLIRFRVSQVRRQWEQGSLWDYRNQWRTPLSTQVRFLFSFAVLAPTGIWVSESAVRAAPLLAMTLLVALALAGRAACLSGLRIMLESKRFRAEKKEYDQRVAEAGAALARWQAKLARKPSDSEMAAWLDCDRKMLMGRALRHYKLAPSDLKAHAFIEAPGTGHRKARLRNGPWRYSAYQILVFLITADGVRQMTADLDFNSAMFQDMQRINYRFDALASVRVTETRGSLRTFELSLVNGQPISVPVTESAMEYALPGESEANLSEVAVDAAGLPTALHVLEGVAASVKRRVRGTDSLSGTAA